MSDGGTGGNEAPWYEGLAPELVGHAQNRGLDKKPAVEAARQLLSDHRETQQKLGIPADQVIRMPAAPQTDAAWDPVWERLGAPKDASGYTFDGIQAAPELIEDVRAAAAAAKLPAVAAARLADALAKAGAARTARTTEQNAAALAADQATLRQSWGANYDLNVFRINNAMAKLGWDAGVLDKIQSAVGGTAVMNGLYQLAQAMAEPQTLRGDTATTIATMTREQAIDRRQSLMNDREWGAKLANGNAEALKEFQDLSRVIAMANSQARR
jgi:hypothetical protein